jgi:hypothetical protein
MKGIIDKYFDAGKKNEKEVTKSGLSSMSNSTKASTILIPRIKRYNCSKPS